MTEATLDDRAVPQVSDRLTTPDQLEMLPDGSVVRGEDMSAGYPDVWQSQTRYEADEKVFWQTIGRSDMGSVSSSLMRLWGPFVVLYVHVLQAEGEVQG